MYTTFRSPILGKEFTSIFRVTHGPELKKSKVFSTKVFIYNNSGAVFDPRLTREREKFEYQITPFVCESVFCVPMLHLGKFTEISHIL